MDPQDTSQAPILRTDIGRTGATTQSGQSSNMRDVNRRFKEADVKVQAAEMSLPYINLSKTPINQDALHLTDLETVQKTNCLPFMLAGKNVHVAAVDPSAESVKSFLVKLQENDFKTELYLCSDLSIEDSFHLFEAFEKKKEIQTIEAIDEEEDKSSENIAGEIFLSEQQIEAKNGPEMLNIVNLAAIKTRASDVHFQPRVKDVSVRFRLDGMLKEVFILPTEKYEAVASQIKKDSKLKLNVGLPQDGQYAFQVNERRVSVRVSSMPTKFGESIVLRMLDSKKQQIKIDQLGISAANVETIRNALSGNSGLILATGPTGSGKTTTLYAMLAEINNPKEKIITLENPVEYEVENISQSEINEDDGYTYELGLKSILRQDPDVIMIGEIRDQISAETSVQAALTGHIVLSTMHSNSAIGTIPRLVNMGVRTYVLASSISLVIAQRLVRKLCACATDKELNEQGRKEMQEVIDGLKRDGFKVDWQVPKSTKTAVGCTICAKTGFQGREVVAEVLQVNEELKDAILRDAGRKELFGIARKYGFITLKEEAIRKVIAGETSMEEVWRVIS
jgi:type II secretory ATPase GspE/PulE/Tfp pilus assembly ATPase PilB-like protein